MHVDLSLIGTPVGAAGSVAARAEALGYDRVWATESTSDPFLQALAVARETTTVSIGTAIVVAFARSPMTVAYAAWDLAAVSGGRFRLGLGSQVRAHIERRFSMRWGQPVRQMEDYVGALRAIWSSWRTGERLDYRSEHYTHRLMTPTFSPPDHGYEVPVSISAVGPKMTELAGRACDGVILHGLTNVAYLDQVTLPALQQGLAAGGRDRAGFEVACPVFLVIGDTEQERAERAAQIREAIAFYASTPSYRPVLDAIGYGEVQPALEAASKRGEWKAMASLVDDTMFDAFALTGTLEEIGPLARRRFAGRIDRVSSYLGWPEVEPDRLTAALTGFRTN